VISAVALVDLDDTLFQTRRKCPADVPFSELTPYAYTADGAAMSFATPKQMALIRWLEASTYLIVVTARSTDALTRTRINFCRAVVAHGGGIIDHHPNAPQPDALYRAEWRDTLRLGLQRPALEAIIQDIEGEAARLKLGVRARIIAEDEMPLYVVVKHVLPDGNDPELHAACEPSIARLPAGWTAHVNGNNVAFLPPGLGKAIAVDWLMSKLGHELAGLPVIGIGDSLTDAGFMGLCDLAITPTRSQLWQRMAGAKAE
jgi:hydroxymethylpyrimidine pyrophosphatase-like HAD family hydrolase